ncbi:hypothetical protein FH972_020327 [Carpinus fangiana]|uniref:Uncharacterized protein n=1 Tax=Carpinus fangiana TaxID=176857 RepID=A0A5N6RWB9_9ROSI|nr:hypothetical protein FH972_020327 [Carpinus fangiana]
MTPKNNNNTTGGPQSDGSTGSSVGTGGGGAEGSGGVALKKGPWTAVEDAILTEYVRKHGEGNWNSVQRNTGLARCGKSCRLRWANHLRPNLKKGAFSPDEERLILELHAKYGNKWARMAAQLPGRTDNEIKNYWNTRVKRRQRQGLPLYPHDIRPSSQFQFQSQSQPTTSPAPTAPGTPTTPNSQTFHFHGSRHPSFSLSPTPPQLSPTSHHQPISAQPFAATSSSSSSSPAFTFQRPTPILGAPFRFKRYRDYNGFSLPISPTPQSNTLTQLPDMTSFQFPMTFSHNSSPQLMRTHLELEQMVSPVSAYSVKQELPSNQFSSHHPPPAEASEITIDMGVNAAAGQGSGNGLLEDLLEEAQALAASSHVLRKQSSLEEKRVLDGFKHWESSSSIHCPSVVKAEEEQGVQLNNMQEDLSKLLNVIPSNMRVPDWYSDSGEISNGQSSGVTDENMGMDMQHIASLFPLAATTDHGRTPGSCSWDNLPGIC